jgi:hypothetical protein
MSTSGELGPTLPPCGEGRARSASRLIDAIIVGVNDGISL